MAEQTCASDLIDNETSIQVGANRSNLCMQASWEIQTLAETLLQRSAAQPDDLDLLVRGLAARILDLGQTISAALGDENHGTEALRHAIYRTATVTE